MKKVLAVCFAVMMSAGAALAQPVQTAPAPHANAAATTNPAARLFTPEQFEKRWETESRMYKEAGIPEEKIQKLHDLNKKIWDARASGQNADFAAIMKQRGEILSQEEIEKIRDLRRKEIEKQLGTQMRSSTATQAINRNTTASAATGQNQ